jgi:uncharacterized protein (TIGR00251 family)
MYIKIKVKTEAKKELITRVSEDHYELSLKEKAERNMANNRILEIFRSIFPNTSVRIISGHTSPSKIISVD